MDLKERKKLFVEKLRKSSIYDTFNVYETPNSVMVRTKGTGVLTGNRLTNEHQLCFNPSNNTTVVSSIRDYTMIQDQKPIVALISLFKDDVEIRRTCLHANGKIEYIIKNGVGYKSSERKLDTQVFPCIKSHFQQNSKLFEKPQ